MELDDRIRAAEARLFARVGLRPEESFHDLSSATGTAFLTEPKDHGYEIRACIRDPDGHLIEVGQTT